MGRFLSEGELYPFCIHAVNLIKMQILYYVGAISVLHKNCVATIGVCVF